MDCHLIDQAQERQLNPTSIRDEMTLIESILDSGPFDVAIVKCLKCGQIFVYCFRQYTSPNGEGDYWTFWIPVAEEEIEVIRTAKPLMKFMGEMVYNRPHICWHPNGQVYWSEKGSPMAFFVFLP